MNLIAQYPTEWNAIVGQQRAITVLHSILKNPRFMLRGFLFYGVLGVGKTATAHLLARALLCTGNDPLGCGKCRSCLLIAEEGYDAHNDFKEVDAAEKSGVQNARDLYDSMTGTPVQPESKRRVVIIDEAHCLSPEAWDVFLKPLDQGDEEDMRTIFIFVSNQSDSIKGTIRSRIARIPFERLHIDTVRGLLAKKASENNIEYELDALTLIARYSKGIAREALNILNTVAACGKVDLELTKAILDTSVEDLSIKMLGAVADKNFKETIRLADEIGRRVAPAKGIETLFSVYGRAIFATEEETKKIYVGLPDVGAVTTLFIKWAATKDLPTDILPIIGYELLQLVAGGVAGVRPNQTPGRTVTRAKSGSSVLDVLNNRGLVVAMPSDKEIAEGALPTVVETPDAVAAFLGAAVPLQEPRKPVRMDIGDPNDPM